MTRFVFALSVFLLSHQLWATSLPAIRKNNASVDLLEAKPKEGEEKSQYEIRAAYEGFLQALGKDPLNPVIRYNIAEAFERNREEGKAYKEYSLLADEAKAAKQEQFEFYNRMNAGRMAAHTGQIGEALRQYQRALEIDPKSKEVKQNIELIWKSSQGQGQGSNKKDQKDPQDDGKGNEPKPNENQKEEKKQPKPFKSQDLSSEDVRKILEELKAQEQKIRAKEYEQNSKDVDNGRDW